MYELYEPSERVFVDREEYIDWMTNAISRCKDKSVVLHLNGIGGIGKSSLIEHWSDTTDQSIVLDCSRVTDFYDRLDTIARGAARFGLDLRRFDVLWHIRQRFVKGVEPAKEEGRGWVMDILAPIDIIVPITNVPRAIKAIGEKLKPILTGKLDDLGTWLQSRLGKDYASRLLEVLWKDPSHAEFVYLNALLEDLNNRKSIEKPLVVMLDGYEAVDKEDLRWTYSGRRISEAELWYSFLSSLANSVGVVASRHAPPTDIRVEESELIELDKGGCMELLEARGISDEEVQTKIISVSGGNPFVLNCICDIPGSKNLSIEDVQNLGAETLEEVRVKTWRRIFSQAEGLLNLIDRAGLVPFINRRIMSIITPSMKSAHWDQMKELSFVRNRGDGTLVLHDLARGLILAELGDKLTPLAEEVSDSLTRIALKESDYSLMGIALSAEALAAESNAVTKVQDIVEKLRNENRYTDAYLLLESVSVSTDEERAPIELLKGRVLYGLDRIAEAENSFRVALDLYRRLSATTRGSKEYTSGVAGTLARLGDLLRWIDRPSESETAFLESIAVYRQLTTKDPEYLKDVAETLCSLTFLLLSRHRENEAEDAVNEAMQIYGQFAAAGQDPDMALSGNASTLIISGRLLGLQDRLSEAEAAFRKAIEIYRELSHKDPDSFLKSVGATLHRLAFILLRRHNAVGAEEALREELDIFRNLAKKAPEAHQRHIARALGSVGYLYFCTGRPSEAEGALRESLEIFKKLAEKSPRAYMDSVANRLNDLGRLQRKLQQYDQAEQSFTEALGLFRELARDAPEVYSLGECASCQVSITLQELGHLFWMTDRLFESEDAYREAINIARAIESSIPHHRHAFLVARMLHDYALLLRHMDRIDEAENALNESLRILRELSQRSPDAYLHVLGSSLNNQAILLGRTDRFSEAENASLEALEIYRNLSKDSPELFLHHYASTLNNHSILLKRLGRSDKAEAAFSEALRINRAAAENSNLVSSLERSEEAENEDLWFHEVFYHWSDCPFCI